MVTVVLYCNIVFKTSTMGSTMSNLVCQSENHLADFDEECRW